MAFSPHVATLLQRLSELVSATWLSLSHWTTKLLPLDVQHRLDACVTTLDALQEAGDWNVIPHLLPYLAHPDPALQRRTALVLDHLAVSIPVRALPGLEYRVRRQYSAWGQMQSADVTRRNWPRNVWALFTMHPSGYVREAAMRRIVQEDWSAALLPYILLRLSDWVEPIRKHAREVASGFIDESSSTAWLPVLGLMQQLQRRSRGDYAELTAKVSALFLRPASRPVLRSAIGSTDRDTVRWAISVAEGLPDAERADYLTMALRSRDTVTRFRAACMVRRWPECPNRAAILQQMRTDPFMPVRREVLYSLLDAPREVRRHELQSMLMDRQASMRHAARFYLREDAVASGESFDARRVYLAALDSGDTTVRAAAIAGLGETGQPGDAERLLPFVQLPRPAIAASAVRAIAFLDRDSRLPLFEDHLFNPHPAVAKEAMRALITRPNAVSTDRLRSGVESAPFAHTRRFALRILLARNPHDAVVDAIVGVMNSDARVRELAAVYLQSWHARPVPIGPTQGQRETIAKLLERVGERLPAGVAKRLRGIFELPRAS